MSISELLNFRSGRSMSYEQKNELRTKVTVTVLL